MAGGGRHVWQGGKGGRGAYTGACVAGEMATAADGTHPTGTHSCDWDMQIQFKFIFSTVSSCTYFGQSSESQTNSFIPLSSESLQHNTNISTTEVMTREVFTGRWSVFNDPMLDPRLIPDDQ